MPRRSSERMKLDGVVYKAIDKALSSDKFRIEMGKALDALWKDLQSLAASMKDEAPAPKGKKKEKKKEEKKEKKQRKPRAEKAEGEAPKRRGRPPKAKSEGEAPKRRGRPPKAKEGDAAPKRRGRPPKAKPVEESVPAPVPTSVEQDEVVVLVRPSAKLDWWPCDDAGNSLWATIDPEGGYVARFEPKYAVDKSDVEEIERDWRDEHDDQDWDFDIRASK